MVQTFFTNITNVHGRTLTHSLQTFQNLNAIRRIVCARLLGIYSAVLFQVFIFCHKFYLFSKNARKGNNFPSEKRSF